MTAKTIVISDLHIGAGPLDDCDETLERCLVDFLKERSADESPVELVINGDFLDFVQAAPWQGPELEAMSRGDRSVPLCFTQKQSEAKFDAISKAHAPIFRALGEFLGAGDGNSLVVMPGNHDADFFWPGVQSLFKSSVCGESEALKGQLNIHLERDHYRPPRCPEVWIEHGHQHDPNNGFAVETDEVDPVVGTLVKKPVWSAADPPIFEDEEGVERLYECTGTRFLIRYMNGLDEKFPFVDNVKPFSRFLRIFGASALKPGYGPLRAASSVWKMLAYLAGEGLTSPGSLLALEKPSEGLGPSALLSTLVGRMSDEETVAFVRALQAGGFKMNVPPAMYLKVPGNAERLLAFLGEHPELADELDEEHRSLLGSAGPGTLSMGKAFFVDETQELVKAVNRILKREEGVSCVVMGHTHEPFENPRYVNTGCWTRYYRFGDDNDLRPWEVLKTDSYELFPYELRYAEIVHGREPAVRSRLFTEKKKS